MGTDVLDPDRIGTHGREALAFPGRRPESRDVGERVDRWKETRSDEVDSRLRCALAGALLAGCVARSPRLPFRGRRRYGRDGLVGSEWTASATNQAGQLVEWDGIDVFPFENGLILRKDIYSSSHRARVLDP